VKDFWEGVAIGGPLVLAVVGIVLALQPQLMATVKRQTLVVIALLVVVALAFYGTKRESDELETSITGGDNYAFITIDTEALKNPEGTIPLLLVNEGEGAVYNVRYWIYPGSTPANRNNNRYWALGLGGAFDWVNPGAIYSTGRALPSGDYMIEVEARNGLVVEHLRIADSNGVFTSEISVRRSEKIIYSKPQPSRIRSGGSEPGDVGPNFGPKRRGTG
jgi:hypothetical protein